VGQRPALTYIFYRKGHKGCSQSPQKTSPLPPSKGELQNPQNYLDNLENLTKIVVQKNTKAAHF